MQTINVGAQTITANWSYEDYGGIEMEDTTVAMPYLKLDALEVVDVKIDEAAHSLGARNYQSRMIYTIPEGQTQPDKSSDISNYQHSTSYYEVTVTLRQHISGVNTPSDVAETVEYVVKYIVALEAKLISTTYEKSYEWAEPKYNLPWRYTLMIKRVRTYSTGKQMTDTFIYPSTVMVSMASSI